MSVVRELPEDVLQRFDNNISNIVNLRVKGWSSAAHYLQKVLPKLEAMGYAFYFYLLCTIFAFPVEKTKV